MPDESRHLLVLMPHTGECWSCAPTVAVHVQRGGRATMVAMCSADWKGHLDYWSEHLENCNRAAEILGCSF